MLIELYAADILSSRLFSFVAESCIYYLPIQTVFKSMLERTRVADEERLAKVKYSQQLRANCHRKCCSKQREKKTT